MQTCKLADSHTRILTYSHTRFLPILVACICLALFSQVRAGAPTAIVLLYFRGAGLQNAILLEWATASEFDTAGFFVERAANRDGAYSTVGDPGFIPAKGDGITGAEYQLIDDNVSNGQTYWYRLVELERNGQRHTLEPIAVTVGVGATPTPQPIVTNTPAVMPSPTAGASQATTATPTSATAGNGGATPAATAGVGGSTTSGTGAQPAASPTVAGADNRNGVGPAALDADDSSFGNAMAQATPVGTPSTGYPGPGDEEPGDPIPGPVTIEAGEDAYPVEQPPIEGEVATPLSPIMGTVPFTTSDPTEPEAPAAAVTVIGSNNQSTPASEVAQRSPNEGRSGRIFLWLAFLASLLIFAAGVVGSIVLFTRQGTGGR